jgi:hypothetical protein
MFLSPPSDWLFFLGFWHHPKEEEEEEQQQPKKRKKDDHSSMYLWTTSGLSEGSFVFFHP